MYIRAREDFESTLSDADQPAVYSLKNILDKEPVAVSAAVKSVLAVLVIAGVLKWSAETVAGAVLALEAVLGLLVRQRSVSAASLAQLDEDA